MENWKIHECVEIKHTPEQPMGQRRNKKKILKQKWKHNIQKLKGCSKNRAQREVNAHVKKKKNLKLPQEKEGHIKPKVRRKREITKIREK